MVFSLFKKKSAARASTSAVHDDVGVVEDVAPGSSVASDSEPQICERELGRLTAEKIDQIESEMISDALAAGVDELEAQAMGLNPAVANKIRKPTAVELLGEVARKEDKRESGVADDDFLADAGVTPSAGTVAYDSGESGAGAALTAAAGASSGRKAASVPSESVTSTAGEPAAPDSEPLAQASTLAGEDPLAIEIVDGAMPEALEESAILFSNGNYAGAREALERAIETGAGHRLSSGYRILAWHMLFDLLRVTGERESFDASAIAYAHETESSPPMWSDDLKAPEKPRSRGGPSHLTIRGVIDERVGSVVDQLQRAAGHKRDCSVDFGEATGVDAQGARQVLRLIERFSSGTWPLRVDGARRMHDLAMAQIETGRRDDEDAFWQLALTSLRLLGDEVGFDDLSIDFCVTYEISPPSWSPLPESIVAGGGSPAEEEAVAVAGQVKPAGPRYPERLQVGGELIGRADELVAAINELTETHESVVLDCLLLRRVDFAAAGVLLNLLIQFQGKGRQLIFQQPNYMVYALMLVMGMHELTTIRRRRV